jgi:quinol monooxygenase YgiN
MTVFTIARYRVRPEGIPKVRGAIEEFVRYIKAHEPGTRLYEAWQEKDDPTRFAHLFIFESPEANELHGRSAAVKRFESVYRPELVEGPVVFTHYDRVASNTEK